MQRPLRWLERELACVNVAPPSRDRGRIRRCGRSRPERAHVSVGERDPGGNAAIVSAIPKATKYPPLALRNQVEGRIFVSFTVNAQGDVSDVKVVKGLGSGLDEETVRAVKTLPKFIPGKQNGRAVSVSFTVPITFKIQ